MVAIRREISGFRVYSEISRSGRMGSHHRERERHGAAPHHSVFPEGLGSSHLPQPAPRRRRRAERVDGGGWTWCTAVHNPETLVCERVTPDWRSEPESVIQTLTISFFSTVQQNFRATLKRLMYDINVVNLWEKSPI